MTWGRLDDHLDDDPRMLAASTADVGVFFLTLPRALREDGEGTIPAGVVARYSRNAQRLVLHGLWVRVDNEVRVAPDIWVSVRMPAEIREKRRQAANARWHPSKPNATAMQMHSTRNAEPVPVTRKEAKASTPKPPPGAVRQVFEAWIQSTGRKACKLDEPRRRKIAARLAEYPLDDVLDAVRGWERDPWEGRRQQNEIAILLRDNAHLEKFRDLWRQPVEASPVADAEKVGAAQFDRRWDALVARTAASMAPT